MTNPMDLSGRTIMVTGASSGIGRETCILLSQLGARVILVARSRERLEQTVALMQGNGHQIEIFDLLKVAETPSWMKRLAGETGPFHALAHCAGILTMQALRYLEPDDLTNVLRINFESAVALAKGFRQRGLYVPGASIVFLASVAGIAGRPGLTAYTASKGAIIAITRTLACELARDKIRVNCIAPAWVETEMTREGMKAFTPEQYLELKNKHLLGFGQPRDVANAVAFLVADTSLWITGTTLIVDGGFTAQ